MTQTLFQFVTSVLVAMTMPANQNKKPFVTPCVMMTVFMARSLCFWLLLMLRLQAFQIFFTLTTKREQILSSGSVFTEIFLSVLHWVKQFIFCLLLLELQ